MISIRPYRLIKGLALGAALVATSAYALAQQSPENTKATAAAVETLTIAEEKSIGFVAIGDTGAVTPWYSFIGGWWGIRGEFWAPGESGLTETAATLRTYCQTNDCKFGVMLGDNIYPDGIDGEDTEDDNERLDKIFTVPFKPLMDDNADFRIYPTLGNHDWRGKRKGVAAQVKFLSTSKPFDMRGLFYRVKPKNAGGDVEIFVIDTQILLTELTVYEANKNDDGSENRDESEMLTPKPHIKPQNDAEKNMLVWLEDALKNSTAKWKFVIGHHPLWSSGGNKFEQSHALRPVLLPILCRYADAYFAGHEHTLEVQEDSCETAMKDEIAAGEKITPLLHIVSGSFSKSRLVHAKFLAKQEAAYPQLTTHYARGKTTADEENAYTQVWGFAHVSLKGDDATIRMITLYENAEGEPSGEPAFECTFSKGRSTDKTRCSLPKK
ncbi:MAG: metallophosphoesterase [Kordiimonadaceae bacterium]|nr:metallophosphoesterase [Kordiimonadaceae bacterium]